jgi:hypothetical protein
MWSAKSLAAVTLAGLLLAACAEGGGFQPLYGQRQGQVARATLAAVQVSTIADRSGQLLRNYLIDSFAAGSAAPRWRLDVTLTENRTDLGLQRDASATYGRLGLTAVYKLVDRASNQVVLEDQSRSLMGYALLEGGFPSVVAENDARQRAIRELGDHIATRLAAKIASLGQPTAGGSLPKRP